MRPLGVGRNVQQHNQLLGQLGKGGGSCHRAPPLVQGNLGTVDFDQHNDLRIVGRQETHKRADDVSGMVDAPLDDLTGTGLAGDGIAGNRGLWLH
jgi:hypothetical protein